MCGECPNLRFWDCVQHYSANVWCFSLTLHARELTHQDGRCVRYNGWFAPVQISQHETSVLGSGWRLATPVRRFIILIGNCDSFGALDSDESQTLCGRNRLQAHRAT